MVNFLMKPTTLGRISTPLCVIFVFLKSFLEPLFRNYNANTSVIAFINFETQNPKSQYLYNLNIMLPPNSH